MSLPVTPADSAIACEPGDDSGVIAHLGLADSVELPASAGLACAGERSHCSEPFGDLMRFYLPTTLAALGSALVAGQVGPAPVTGFAVTPSLRAWYACGDFEELEYFAMVQAAHASLRLLTN